MNMPSTSDESREAARPPPSQAPWCLFLDIDGTLLDIAPTSDAVTVDAALLDLLRGLELLPS
jgi:trehalose 6-phosphate phosphatase